MSTMYAREYAGNPIKPDVNIFQKQSFKQGEKPRKLDEDYFLYSIKNLLKDNLNEYPGKQLDRPNKLDLTSADDRELNSLEEKKWIEHDLLQEQRAETFKNFTFPPHMSPQEKCVDQLQQDYEDYHMLCLRDMFRDRECDLEGFDRTPAQDKDELKEMNLTHESLLKERSKLPKKQNKSSYNRKFKPISKKRISPKEKRTIIRQTKTTTTRIFKKPISSMEPISKTEVISQTFTRPMTEIPSNDPKSKPKSSTQSYTVDLSQLNNNSWVWDNGQIKKL
ncbi:hypothetical protein RB653_008568 [Dictyostelium firmibasis]|uniref:Uncharacterized protein n=1 Tax=Dictyostelium firmibasis TaxID=79012 RepID=A0AAN7U0P1_9MYCE